MTRNRTRREKEMSDKGRKRILLVVGTLVSVYLVYSLVFSDLGLVRYYALHGEYTGVQKEIRNLEAENDRLRNNVEALKTDPEVIEKLAREKLGLVREGEIVYQFTKP